MGHRWVLIIVILFLFGSIAPPVNAHTTLGDLTGSPRFFRHNDNELNPSNTFGTAHVPGPLGFVWPGSGLDSYTGLSSNPPGYQSPFETFESPLQVAGDSYSPEGAILTSMPGHDNVGDLIFAINFSQPQLFHPNLVFNYSSLVIYIPAPIFDRTGNLIQDGFEPTTGISWGDVGIPAQYTYNTGNAVEGNNANIVTTITDDYGSISVGKGGLSDPFGPGWWIIQIRAPISGISFTAAHNWSEVYYVRINQMKAPETAGRYFFKMFLNDSYPLHSQSPSRHLFSEAMPVENWPVLLVKGEVDPAIISGTVRYGDLNATLFGLPIELPGKVRAVGVATDPVTGELTGRAVEARGYFNATEQGHYEVEGVAPGIYDIYASAAGYPEQKAAANVHVLRGQSLHTDLYLKVGPELSGTVYSKENFGEVPWPGQRPIQIVIFDSYGPGYNRPQNVQSFSPANLTHAPFTSYVTGNTVFCPPPKLFINGCSDNRLIPPNTPKQVSFPWEGPVGYYSLTPPSSPGSTTSEDPFGLFNGVGPAQTWWVDPQGTLNPADELGSTNSEFSFQFGSESVYGVPTKLSGMVPQVFATWTNGLSPGQYYIRVFVNGYVQTENTGGSFMDYPFVVSDTGPQDIEVPIDLFESSSINVTVHFHNLPGTLVEGAVEGPDPARFLIAEAFSEADSTMAAFNFTQVYANNTQATISLNGFGMAGAILPSSVPSISDPREFIKYSLARYRGLPFYDYGLPTDSYTIHVYMRGYIQALPPATTFDMIDQPVTITVSIGTAIVQVSTHMYRGGGINVTLSSIDWEKPPIDSNWIWNGAPVTVLVYDFPSQRFQDVILFWDNTQPNLNIMGGNWVQPQQNSNFNTLPYSQWQSIFGPGASYVMTNGSVSVDEYGPDIPSISFRNPAQAVSFQFTKIFTQQIFLVGFLWNSTLYRLPLRSSTPFRSNIAIYPGTYSAVGWTYGYVQDNVAAPGDVGNDLLAVSWLGSIADIRVQSIVGVNFTLSMIFKDEKILTGLPYNSSVRIRVYDAQDTLIAATTLFSDGTLAGPIIAPPNPPGPFGFFADGKSLIDEKTKQVGPSGVPTGTKELTYADLAGMFRYTDPGTSNIDINTLFSFDRGVWGSSMHPGAYAGDWSVMVDVVNWYMPTTFSAPVPGLLQGESPYFFPYNHLGPFRQNGLEIVSNVWQGGEASAIFELDQRGLVQGTVLAMNWVNQDREASWITLAFTQNSSSYQYYWYTWDGFFDGYLDPGLYQMTITEWIHNEGHFSQQLSVPVSLGENSKSTTIILEESGIPINVPNELGLSNQMYSTLTTSFQNFDPYSDYQRILNLLLKNSAQYE
jgi:hypothetical protein